MVAIDLLDMAVLRLTLAPSQHHSQVGQEHGRTIPLAVLVPVGIETRIAEFSGSTKPTCRQEKIVCSWFDLPM